MAKKLAEIDLAEPTGPRGLSALFPGAKTRYEKRHSEWMRQREMLSKALRRTSERGALVREFAVESIAGYPGRGWALAQRKAGQRHPELAETIENAQEKQKSERKAAIHREFEKQLARERGGRGR